MPIVSLLIIVSKVGDSPVPVASYMELRLARSPSNLHEHIAIVRRIGSLQRTVLVAVVAILPGALRPSLPFMYATLRMAVAGPLVGPARQGTL